jgi:hypothetical protein
MEDTMKSKLEDRTRTTSCISWAFEQQMDPLHKIVLIALCDNTGNAVPKALSLCLITSMSIPEIESHFQWLRLHGYILELYGRDVEELS